MQPNSNWHFRLFQTFSLVGIISILTTFQLFSQNNITVRIDQGEATSTCTDGLDGQAEPLWQINVENEGWITYSDCHTDLPNTQFITTLDCLGELRGGEVQICLKVFENDASLFDPCRIDIDCEAMICEYFVIPLAGEEASYELSISDGLASGGRVSFTVATDGMQTGAVNDHICHAIDLGVLEEASPLGKKELGMYDNFCATATEETNPRSLFPEPNESFTNNVGVWFSFNTGDQPSELILVEALSDPEATGDPLSLQLALYQATDNDCIADLIYLTEHHDPATLDEYLLLECLPPNETFYILVDGVYDETTLPDLPLLNGIFSMSIRSLSVTGGNDQICDAQLLEVADGETNRYSNFFNNCATNTNDPTIDNFSSLQPVWFQFQAPTSRRVKIEVTGNLPYPDGIDPIIPQIVVFEAEENDCSKGLKRLGHHYDSDTQVNTIGELDCLDPANTYWLMVDGNEEQPTGIFDITIQDLGYPAIQMMDTIICEGSQITLGDKVYTEAGIYLDTIISVSGCLDIYETTLREADSIAASVTVSKIASREEVADGIAVVEVTGGSGNYTVTGEDGVAWEKDKDNAGTFIKENLIGGEGYCVTVSDVIGCSEEVCFDMPFVKQISIDIAHDTLDCFGYTNGQLELTIKDGHPPYQYTFHNSAKQILEMGTVEDITATLLFENLKEDNYTVIIYSLSNPSAVNNLTGRVESPNPIEVTMLEPKNASCFNACDASIQLFTEGGNGDFKFYWNNNLEEEFTGENLCADNYKITATDEKNCTKVFDFAITEPAAFVAKATQIQPVKCFGEENGAASISTNGNPIKYEWDNGADEMSATNLSGGIHTVIITNEDNCVDTALVEIAQPESPITAKIEILSDINCFGDANGLLKGTSTGGNGDYRFTWNNNTTDALLDKLPAGTYELTVTDQLDCSSTALFQLDQPSELSATLTTQDVTCPGGPESGSVQIENTTGGTIPYGYSLAKASFTLNSQFDRLTAGTYEVVVQDANGCEIMENAVVKNPPPLKLNLGEDQNIKLGKTVQLEAITNRPVQYEWTVPDSINCGDCPSINFLPFTSANYAIKVTDLESECTATDEVYIVVSNEREIFVPNVFSPNGDGNNDFLMVYGGPDIRNIKDFKVFDRQGSLVYEASNFSPNDPSISWRGEHNGQRLAPAVFIYFAEIEFIDGLVDVFSGDFALMR